jgi:hypothetical protein
MKYFQIFLAALFLNNFFLYGISLADLNNELYVQAKEFYIQDDYVHTIQFMNKYKKQDRQFLKENPDILAKIEKVIKYCKQLSSSSLSLQGVRLPPLLPEN